MADKGKFSLQTLIALGIDGISFAGANELVAVGYKGAKVTASDTVVYLLVDFLIRRNYLVNSEIFSEVKGMEMGEPYALETYKGLIAALGLMLKDSLMKKKMVILDPIIKAMVGSIANGFVDDIFGLKKIA